MPTSGTVARALLPPIHDLLALTASQIEQMPMVRSVWQGIAAKVIHENDDHYISYTMKGPSTGHGPVFTLQECTTTAQAIVLKKPTQIFLAWVWRLVQQFLCG